MYIKTSYQLPTVTRSDGSVMAVRPRPIGICPVRLRMKSATRTIRPAGPRAKVVMMPNPRLGNLGAGFWSTMINGSIDALKGALASGGNPAGAVTGAASAFTNAGGAASTTGKAAQAAVPQNGLGPLATLSTPMIVGISLGAAALLLAIAK